MEPYFSYGKLPAQDVARARRFYADTLGLEPFGEHNDHLFYDVAGTRFMIFPSIGKPSGMHDQFGFVVGDIGAEVTRLRENGVDLLETPVTRDGVAELGPVRAAWFKDSEGNLLNLIEGNSPLWSR